MSRKCRKTDFDLANVCQPEPGSPRNFPGSSDSTVHQNNVGIQQNDTGRVKMLNRASAQETNIPTHSLIPTEPRTLPLRWETSHHLILHNAQIFSDEVLVCHAFSVLVACRRCTCVAPSSHKLTFNTTWSDFCAWRNRPNSTWTLNNSMVQ